MRVFYQGAESLKHFARGQIDGAESLKHLARGQIDGGRKLEAPC